MHKTSSPYLKELYKGGIKWMPFNAKTLKYAQREDRIIYIHIGYTANMEAREKAYKLFEDEEVINVINNNFIPIAIDLEDVPEAMMTGMDLLVLSRQNYSIPINIFALPSGKPFTSFSNASPEEFLSLAQNVIFSFSEKRELLNKAGKYIAARLKGSGIVPEREKPSPIDDKLLHAYVKSWMTKYISSRQNRKKSPYTINSRYYIFLLKYACHYGKTDEMEFIFSGLDKLYYSPMFDCIGGGLFSQSTDNSFAEPLWEKQLSENIQAALLYAFAYKYRGKEHYKEAAMRIIEFIESCMKSEKWGYITSITLKGSACNAMYYKLSLNELKIKFKDGAADIARALGMDPGKDPDEQQTVHHTIMYKKLSGHIKDGLLMIRKGKCREILKDNRVITAYNCMYATALCMIANIIEEKREAYTAIAGSIIENILSRQKADGLKLYRYISSNRSEHQSAQLLDYSFFLNALLNMYRQTGNSVYDKLISKYTAYILLNYYHSHNGMFSKSSKSENTTPFKRESNIDYVRYSANSVMAGNLLMLQKMRKDDFYLYAFKQQIYNIASQLIGTGPLMVGWALQILDYLSGD